MPFGEVLGHSLLPVCCMCVAEASDEILVPLIGMSVLLLIYNRAKILFIAFIFRWQCHLFIFE